jgi:hypothetical protein
MDRPFARIASLIGKQISRSLLIEPSSKRAFLTYWPIRTLLVSSVYWSPLRSALSGALAPNANVHRPTLLSRPKTRACETQLSSYPFNASIRCWTGLFERCGRVVDDPEMTWFLGQPPDMRHSTATTTIDSVSSALPIARRLKCKICYRPS